VAALQHEPPTTTQLPVVNNRLAAALGTFSILSSFCQILQPGKSNIKETVGSHKNI
jgi:hypothetical protein